ncbi:alpha-ketoglutarate-dependent dioxygenase AlkB [Armatimonas sp.]|uniref:alpha-ketoglutarate-dependent dioxygenase AlkB n=1 Tax=Armatimonas sp. TaxID=1872638 RepID=UPI00374CEC86
MISVIEESKTPSAIMGMSYYPEFLTSEQEASLLAFVDSQPWNDTLSRATQHYGYRYDYTVRQLDMSHHLGPLPAPLQEVGTRLVDAGYFAKLPEQVIVNEYLPGQGIAAHIDCVPCFGSAIASLTLGSGCTMDFTQSATLEKVSLYLEPRSLVVLAATARYDWRHGIAGRRSDRVAGVVCARGRRVSLTFRTVVL